MLGISVILSHAVFVHLCFCEFVFVYLCISISEMEKRVDGADASVLFFFLCCANFLTINVQNS